MIFLNCTRGVYFTSTLYSRFFRTFNVTYLSTVSKRYIRRYGSGRQLKETF